MPKLLELKHLYRDFPAGDSVITVLNDINLTINAGEMVAIVGASGSGKSTLMNILGCLDRPSRGSYHVNQRETGQMKPDELAQLRREHFGFIFQRYHLMTDMDALTNVEVPAIYSGQSTYERRERSKQLLTILGLAAKLHNKPNQLSGGQQQRVSIARALINGGEVILADEPTGALDTHSGAEVMQILCKLHAEGHTVIIVTHDMKVATHAERLIEISDGVIVHDRIINDSSTVALPKPIAKEHHNATARLIEAAKMAFRSLRAHRIRAFLTMLGIIVGIAAVSSINALGNGLTAAIKDKFGAIGNNAVEVNLGSDWGAPKAGDIRTLNIADVQALVQHPHVLSATPAVNAFALGRFNDTSANDPC